MSIEDFPFDKFSNDVVSALNYFAGKRKNLPLDDTLKELKLLAGIYNDILNIKLGVSMAALNGAYVFNKTTTLYLDFNVGKLHDYDTYKGVSLDD